MKANILDLDYENAVFVLAYLQGAPDHFKDERNRRRASEALEDFSRAMREDSERCAAVGYVMRLRESRTDDSG